MNAFDGFDRGVGRLLQCRGVRGDVGLIGDVGPEIVRRPEGSTGAKESLNLPIARLHKTMNRTDQW